MAEKMTNDNGIIEQDDKDFEQWYAENAFDFERDPIGSRDCGLQRKAWHAAMAARRQQEPFWMADLVAQGKQQGRDEYAKELSVQEPWGYVRNGYARWDGFDECKARPDLYTPFYQSTMPAAVPPSVPLVIVVRDDGTEDMVGIRAIDYGKNGHVETITVDAPTMPAAVVPGNWHAPGLGEVHHEDHRHMIYCESENKNGENVADDDLAKQVAALLNAQPGKESN